MRKRLTASRLALAGVIVSASSLLAIGSAFGAPALNCSAGGAGGNGGNGGVSVGGSGGLAFGLPGSGFANARGGNAGSARGGNGGSGGNGFVPICNQNTNVFVDDAPAFEGWDW